MNLKLVLISLLVISVGVLIPKAEVSAGENATVYTEYITGEELKELQDYMVSHTVESMRASLGINWTVPANTRYKTGSITMSANDAILVYMRLSSTGQVGIIGFDGKKVYVTQTYVNQYFNTWSAQSYAVFVQNNSSSSITATGSYSY